MDQKTRRRRDRDRSRSRSRSRSYSPHRKTNNSKSYHHRSNNNYHNNNSHYNKTEMSNRLHEIKNLRQQLSKPAPSYNRRYHQKLSEQQYLDRVEKRKNMKVTISVWMQSPERDINNTNNNSNQIDDDIEQIETFNDERQKHIRERKHHIKRHENEIKQRTYQPENDTISSDTNSNTTSNSDSSSDDSSNDSDSSDSSSTDSEEERERRRRRRKRRKRQHKRKRHRRRKRTHKHRKKKKRRKYSSEESSSGSGSDSESIKADKVKELDKKVVPVMKDFPSEDEIEQPQAAKKKEDKDEFMWVEENGDDGSSSDSDADLMDVNDGNVIGPKQIDDVTSKLDRRDYGGAMLPGEADAIANFVQRGMRIPRRGEVGLTSEEIASFENTGFVMSGSRHKRMNAIRIRKENQIYSAEEKRALTMVNFEEKLNREKKLMAQYQKLLNEKMKK